MVLISVAFGGVNPTLKKLHSIPVVNWLSSCSFARWFVEAFYLSEVGALKQIYDIEPGIKFLDYKGDTLVMPFVYMIVIGVVFRVLALSVYAVPPLKMWLIRPKKKVEAKKNKWSVKHLVQLVVVVSLVLLAILTVLAILAGMNNL